MAVKNLSPCLIINEMAIQNAYEYRTAFHSRRRRHSIIVFFCRLHQFTEDVRATYQQFSWPDKTEALG